MRFGSAGQLMIYRSGSQVGLEAAESSFYPGQRHIQVPDLPGTQIGPVGFDGIATKQLIVVGRSNIMLLPAQISGETPVIIGDDFGSETFAEAGITALDFTQALLDLFQVLDGSFGNGSA